MFPCSCKAIDVMSSGETQLEARLTSTESEQSSSIETKHLEPELSVS